MRIPSSIAALALSLGCGALAAAGLAAPLTATVPEADFFEREIRPLLVTECGACHGAAVQQGGLRLDSRAALLKGGGRGPVLAPGHPERSLLLQAVRHQGLKMPPGKRLPESRAAALEAWVRAGAPWPDAGAGGQGSRGAGGTRQKPATNHWAFQPVRRPVVARVKHPEWVKNPIDAFVLARLEKAGLSPSPPADPRTLIRRVTYDLTGLPPTPEEVEAFARECAAERKGSENGSGQNPKRERGATLVPRSKVRDTGAPLPHGRGSEGVRVPSAYDRLVDRLLASPAYGERWGRHWLDVARYADTKDGVLMYGDARVRPYAYTYRDYVIRALNEDTPYDRFVQEQLAADQLQAEEMGKRGNEEMPLRTITPFPRFPISSDGGFPISSPPPPWRLAAMGFLTLGRQFDNNVHDVIDDRIDTVSRGLLGLTVACARCHDHKYDPVPTADYYSLYGVFASSETPTELPLIEAPGSTPDYAAFEKEYTAKKRQLEEHVEKQFALLSETARQRVGDYLVHVATTEPDPLETAIFFLSLAPEDLRPQIVARWRRLLEQRARPEDPVFGPWAELLQAEVSRKNAKTQSANGADAPASNLQSPIGAPTLVGHLQSALARWSPGTLPGQVNPLVLQALREAKPADRAAVARAYGDLLRRVDEESRKPDAPPLTPERRQLLELVNGPDSPGYFPKHQTYSYMSRGEKDAFGGMRNELDVIGVRHADAPARAMVLTDTPERHDPRIFVRGNAAQPGDAVPRRSLQILAGENRQPFPNGSGRLDLARAITDPKNPLTARVLVNRVWMHHFGEPLVASPSDFGLRSAPPTHPELLDFLATEFMAGAGDGNAGERGSRGEGEQGRGRPWSLKALHRLMVTSATYQQSSDVASGRAVVNPKSKIGAPTNVGHPKSGDPENRLLWRANRRRLDFEQMRDTLLAVSGRLDRTMFGRPVREATTPESRRRTVYCMVDRQALPEVFRAFNFAQPDQSVERRPQTTVPQQALFALNSPFVLEQARALAKRPEVAGAASDSDRVAALYRLVLTRPPTPEETAAGLEFVRAADPKATVAPWEQYAQVLLLTNELMFID